MKTATVWHRFGINTWHLAALQPPGPGTNALRCTMQHETGDRRIAEENEGNEQRVDMD